MTSPVRTARAETPISDLVMWMSTAGLHHLPVVATDEKLIGIVSQTDLVAQMLAGAVDGAEAPRPALAAGVPA
ncbi:CBS domain-containing protein [uncultured Methylobacterium sp.]|uniref:CBS domain-containing protein n=1 Tax=uncultured Methylobacterium sp. TaxID=157278 RepID=UPI0035C96C95